jgi:hypothetical protein
MYKYKGGGFIVGIPARDISKEEFETFDKVTQEAIKTSGLYELVKKPSAKDTQEE